MSDENQDQPFPPADPVMIACIYEESHSPNIHLWPQDADPSFGKAIEIELGLHDRFVTAEREFLEVSALVRKAASEQ